MSFFKELKRRSVFKVTVAYALVAWLVAQLAEFATGTFGAPGWVLRTFVVLLLLGFPVAITLAWAFDLTPSGIKKASGEKTGPNTSKGTNFFVIILLGVVLTAAAVVIVAGTAVLALTGGPGPGDRTSLAAASPTGSGETLVSPVVDPWLESDSLTIEAVEELVTVGGPARGLR